MFKYFLNILFFVYPTISLGQIIFSEIMFDAEGTDAGHEWVEIKNTQNFSIDIKDYKFCEGAPTCHSWADGENPDFEIGANSLAIITDDREKFLNKHSFSGLILVSTGFTLNNTGELIQIKNPSGNLEDSLTYNPEVGGKNGETLSVFNNIWKDSEATPGQENSEKASSIEKTSTSDEVEEVNTSYMEVSSDQYMGKKKLKAEINEVGVVMAGAKTKISGRAYGISGVEISGIDFFWNFGDGKKEYGQEIFHEFIFPGEYIVSLVVKSGNFTGEEKIKIKVIDPSVEISDVKESKGQIEGFIKIKNNSGYVLNLSGWVISVDGEEFEIPEGSFVAKNSESIFPNRITDLWPKSGEKITEKKTPDKVQKSKVFLKFPNGKKFFSYSFEKEEVSLKALVEKKHEKGKIKITYDPKVIYIKKDTKKKEPKIVGQINVGEKSEEKKEVVVFNSEEYFLKKYSLRSSKSFVKDQWPFLTFIFFIGSLIVFILYIKKQEGSFCENDGNFALENPLQKTEKEKYEEEIRSEADEYEIEDMVEK